MFYTYILVSISHPNQIYIGHTQDLKNRLSDHNQGKNTHSKKYIPWTIETYLAFPTKQKTIAFEKYLKTGSGFSFRKRHL